MKFLKLSLAGIVAASCFVTVAHANSGEFCSLARSALHKNQNLTALRHQLEASDERIIQSENINGPKLDLLANLSAYTDAPGKFEFATSGNLSIRYTQTLFDSGVADARKGQAKGNKNLLALDLESSSRDTIVQVGRGYVTFLKNIQLLSLSRKNLGNTNEQLRNVQEKFAASEATQQELLLVKSRVRQAMSDMLRAKAQVILSRVRLLTLTNKKPVGNDFGFLRTLLTKAPKSRAAAVEVARSNSIEIDKTDIAIDIAQFEIKAQEASLGVKLDLTASAGLIKIDKNSGVGARVGLALSIPIYSSGVLESKVREAKAMLASARARRAYMTELSKQNVGVAYEIAQSVKQAIAILPEAIQAEEEAINSLEQSLASSFISVAEVLLVKKSLFDLRKSLVNLKFERYLGHLELLNNIGQLKSVASLHNVGLCK